MHKVYSTSKFKYSSFTFSFPSTLKFSTIVLLCMTINRVWIEMFVKLITFLNIHFLNHLNYFQIEITITLMIFFSHRQPVTILLLSSYKKGQLDLSSNAILTFLLQVLYRLQFKSRKRRVFFMNISLSIKNCDPNFISFMQIQYRHFATGSPIIGLSWVAVIP